MSVNDLKKVYVDVSSSNDELSDSSDVSQIMLTDKLKTLLPNETTSLVCKKLAAELNILQYKNLKIVFTQLILVVGSNTKENRSLCG